MTTPIWQPGTLALPGDLVQPRSRATPTAVPLVNGDFSTGDLTGWALTREGGTGGALSVSTTRSYSGNAAAKWTGAAGTSRDGTAAIVMNTAQGPVTPGQPLTVRAYIAFDDTGNSRNWGAARIYWFQANGTPCTPAYTHGNEISGNLGFYRQSIATGTAPAGAAYARAALWLTANHEGAMYGDGVTWDHAPPASDPSLIYKAVQASSAHTGPSEPAWPGVLGQTIVDGGVTWEAVNTSRVVWQALPLLTSGPTEPAWPLAPGAFVADGSVSWECVSLAIEDENCPHSTVVAIAESKVFAGDGDIVRACATANPLDWQAEDDATFLPTGLQQGNANDVAVLNLYRSNLAVLNANGFQMWQVDPDPQAMARLDEIEGLGSTFQSAAQAFANDLFVLTARGVRTLGLAAASESLAAGDAGEAIDPLVRAKLDAVTDRRNVVSAKHPATGQYWLGFVDPVALTTEVFVDTMQRTTHRWGRYLLPYAVEAFPQLGDDLFIRARNAHGDFVVAVDEAIATDDVLGAGGTFTATGYPGRVQWGWLDLGAPGTDKELEGFDVVGSGSPSVSIGYNQKDPDAFTAPYAVDADTLTGDIIPLPVVAPTMSLRVDFATGAPWKLQQATLYLRDRKGGS